jgi:electron transfer flavoprotein-quinone oxidoreductase
MRHSRFDVAIVGAGCAGLTAAIALARAGFRVAVVEAADFPGAENWSGCVYFTENLAAPDVLGADGVEALAWERRLVERGLFATDGHGLLGATYRDPQAFRHCYTVLRPLFDQHLALVAQSQGVALLCATTVESLIRDQGRIVGVCTNRGPLYADLVFLAEGDASHLVTREGYERSSDPRDAPRFLLGVKQIIELPAGAIEERFKLNPDEGAAYQILLRNGTMKGQSVPLNATGFLVTNRVSLSIGLMLPADHLARHFAGSPAGLLDWLEGLPALRPWLREGRRSTYGAKVLRGGGLRDLPYLIDDGLAIGGAASALGTNFPFPNFIGPATATGLLLARAAMCIRAEGGDFTRATLARHYLEPLRQTCYWKDAEFLRRWPGYVKRTRVLFAGTLDLALGSARVWTRPGGWSLGRLYAWLRLLRYLAGPGRWGELQGDLRRLGWALRFRALLGRPALGRLLLDGSLNAFRDLLRRPRSGLPPAGALRLHYSRAGGAERVGSPPYSLRRWFVRFVPVLGAAASGVYRNDAVPLPDKLITAGRLLLRQINLLDLLGLAVLTIAALVSNGLRAAWNGLRRRKHRPLPRAYRAYAEAAHRASDLPTSLPPRALPAKERPLYSSISTTSVNVLWPRTIADKDAAVRHGPWPVCPGGVFEPQVGPDGLARVAVHAERCLKCEACWRVNDQVDWGRDGGQRLIYHVSSPASARLIAAADAVGGGRPVLPRVDKGPPKSSPLVFANQSEIARLLDQLEEKLTEYDRALGEPPRTIDRARADYLEMLARYAQQLAERLVELLPPVGDPASAMAAVHLWAVELRSRAEERSRRTWDGRFAWAAADGRQMRFCHLAELRRRLAPVDPVQPPSEELDAWLGAELRVASAEHAVPSLLAEANALLRQMIAFAATRTLCPGFFRDERGRDTVGKFGAVKRRVASWAARCFLIETFLYNQTFALFTESEGGPSLLEALFADVPGAEGRRSSEPLSAETWRRHGERVLRAWRADGSRLARIGDEKLFEQMNQRKALQAEAEEILRQAARLTKGVNDWLARRGQTAPEADRAEMAEALGRQDAYLLASQALLLRTHARLERGFDCQIALPLLRVWLDEAAAALDDFTALVRRGLQLLERRDNRPLVEPEAGPPPASWSEFLAAPDLYQTGDFLAAPVNLFRPRLTPEVVLAGVPLSRLEPGLANRTFERFSARVSRYQAGIQENLEKARAIAGGNGTISGSMAWRLHQMEEDALIAETVACDVVGRLGHPGTISLHLERIASRILLEDFFRRGAALVKEIQMLAEPGYWPREEKTPLSAKPLALREFRMELPRFVLLKGLAEEVAPRWRAGPRRVPRHLGREALELEALKAGFRQIVDVATDVFGRGLWQNPNLQINAFPLAEAAAWLLAADALLGRLAFVARKTQGTEDGEPPAVLGPGRRALARCGAEVRDRLRRFSEEMPYLRRGYYAPHVRAAVRIFDPPPPTPLEQTPTSQIKRPLAIVILVAPVRDCPGNSVPEELGSLTPADRAALETALRLRDAAPDKVSLRVIAFGPPRVGLVLREILSLGVESVRLLPDSENVSLERIRPDLEGKTDLLLGGANDGEEHNYRIQQTAAALGLPFGGTCSHLTIEEGEPESRMVRLGTETVRRLPLAAAVEPGLELRPFTVAGWLEGLAKEIEASPGGKKGA